jgi:hypothetical protein
MQLERLFKVLVVHGAVLTAGPVGCEPSGSPAEGKSAADATPEAARLAVAGENDGATLNSMFDSGDVVVAEDAASDAARLPDSMFDSGDVVAAEDAADGSKDAPAEDGVGSWLSWG